MDSISAAYQPCPIAVDDVELPGEIMQLVELLAKNAHDTWAQKRIAEGWQYGGERDGAKKLTPCLARYEDLPESEREYDRALVGQTLKAILKLGYHIEKDGPPL
jgi:hypothetical protein